MCCSFENNLTLRKAVVLATLLLITSTGTLCCKNCDSRMNRERDNDEPTVKNLPLKKDIFMSRGWGAGGGTPFTARTNPDLYKKNRVVVDMMLGDDYKPYDHPMEPRVEFLRSPVISKSIAPPRRRVPAYVPQLFISSGWGPLGK